MTYNRRGLCLGGPLFLLHLMLFSEACDGDTRVNAMRRIAAEVRADSCLGVAPVGSHPSRRGRYVIEVRALDAGRERLELHDSSGKLLWSHNDDISSILWLPDETAFLFSTSPIYGVPGIHMIEIDGLRLRRVVSPTITGDPNYPGGAEWVSLCSVHRRDARFVVEYVFFRHVDSVAFERFPEGGTRRELVVP